MEEEWWRKVVKSVAIVLVLAMTLVALAMVIEGFTGFPVMARYRF